MYFQKEQIVAKIAQISHEKHRHDSQFSELQQLIASNKKYDVVQLRRKFSVYIEQLSATVRENLSVLDLLKYRAQKIAKQGSEMVTQLFRIQSLKEYFIEFKEKINREKTRGQEIISGRQRWELTSKHGDKLTSGGDEEAESLIYSANAAKQTTQMAREVYSNLTTQSNRLESAREKMGSVLQNINLAGNIAQLLRTRTKQDNKLIMRYSVGLIIWTVICIYVLKPMIRGS